MPDSDKAVPGGDKPVPDTDKDTDKTVPSGADTPVPSGDAPAAPPAPDPSEAPTTAIPHAPRATPTRVGPGVPPPPGAMPGVAAAPVRVPETQPRQRRRWPLVVFVIALLVAAATAVALIANRVSGNTTEDAVRAAISDFVTAIDRGDLAALRAGTCGELGTYYQQISDADFADVYQAANSDRAVPVLDSIDAVAVTEGTALAQVTVHTANAPTQTSVRSFALEQQDGVWKVCS